MSRTARLLDLLQILRRHRHPVAGQVLADELGVSLRTVYRDIATLIAQGAPIEGEAGLGYVMAAGQFLPPLMFRAEELEALTLGARLVARRADEPLARAATEALARISAVLPDVLRDDLAAPHLLAGPVAESTESSVDAAMLRRCLRDETRLRLLYADAAGATTERVVWPLALAYFETVQMLVAWCELRVDFRTFRIDRIREATPIDGRFGRRRAVLLAEWRRREGIPAD